MKVATANTYPVDPVDPVPRRPCPPDRRAASYGYRVEFLVVRRVTRSCFAEAGGVASGHEPEYSERHDRPTRTQTSLVSVSPCPAFREGVQFPGTLFRRAANPAIRSGRTRYARRLVASFVDDYNSCRPHGASGCVHDFPSPAGSKP